MHSQRCEFCFPQQVFMCHFYDHIVPCMSHVPRVFCHWSRAIWTEQQNTKQNAAQYGFCYSHPTALREKVHRDVSECISTFHVHANQAHLRCSHLNAAIFYWWKGREGACKNTNAKIQILSKEFPTTFNSFKVLKCRDGQVFPCFMNSKIHCGVYMNPPEQLTLIHFNTIYIFRAYFSTIYFNIILFLALPNCSLPLRFLTKMVCAVLTRLIHNHDLLTLQKLNGSCLC
jgi:hypothetical protein